MVVPVVMPGIALSAGILTAIHLCKPHLFMTSWETLSKLAHLNAPAQGPAIAALLAIVLLSVYAISVMLGIALAIVSGYFEYFVLDKIYTKCKSLSWSDYWNQWLRYVDHLETENGDNPYISSLVVAFLFQLRMSLALLILFIVFAFLFTWENLLHLILFVPALALLISACVYHMELANFRNRRFGELPPTKNDFSSIAKGLISTWCKREEVVPLKLIIQTWPPKDNDKSDHTNLLNSLAEAQKLADHIVFPNEKKDIAKAISFLQAAIAQQD